PQREQSARAGAARAHRRGAGRRYQHAHRDAPAEHPGRARARLVRYPRRRGLHLQTRRRRRGQPGGPRPDRAVGDGEVAVSSPPAMPFRSDVVGSLLRPAYLLDARAAVESGRLSAPDFKRIEDRAVDEAVRLQEGAGLDVVSDGEMRRYAFFGHMIEALAGFDKHGGWAIPFRDERGEELVFKRPVVVEKLAWRRSMCGEEFAYLRARASRPTKVTLISAQQAAAYYDPKQSGGAYPTRDAFFADVVDFNPPAAKQLVPF